LEAQLECGKAKIDIVVEQHCDIRQSACSFPRRQIVLLATKPELINLIVPRGAAPPDGITIMVLKPKGLFIRYINRLDERLIEESVRQARRT
jgi:hypothetical protein